MSIFVYVYDTNNNLVNDLDLAMEYADSLDFSTVWPGGFDVCSFEVRRDVGLRWAVKQAYKLKVKDGHTTVFEGRIDDLDKSLAVDRSIIRVRAVGWFVVLVERKLRKRWVDNAPFDRMVWPSDVKSTEAQTRFDATKREDHITIRGGYGDNVKTQYDLYVEEYVGPVGHYIRRVESQYMMRTGEGFSLIWRNPENNGAFAIVTDNSGTEVTGSLNANVSGPSTSNIRFQCRVDAADTYDENDRAQVHNVTFWFDYHSSHPDYASPTYTNGEILIDVLIICGGSDLSGDYDDITDPGLVLNGFMTANDSFETGDKIIKRLLSFGDSSQNTYGLAIWSSDGTSDNLPKAQVMARSTDDYEWMVNLAELVGFDDSFTFDDLANWVIIEFTDDENQRQFLSPLDDTALQDTASISMYGERHSEVINIGKATSAEALNVGKRVLSYRKDPLRKSELNISGEIRNSQGAWLPVSRVRAGDRLRVLDYENGITYFLRTTRYKEGVLSVSPDVPPDSLAVFLAQRDLQ